MAYKYHYAGEQAVELPTHHINTEGKDKDFVYETTEPINHPDFSLVKDQQEEERTQEEVASEVHVEEVQPTENVQQEGDAQVESV